MSTIRRAIAATVLLVAITPPVNAEPPQVYQGSSTNDQTYGSPHEMPTDDVPRPVSRDAASRAIELRLSGKCEQAVPILRHVVNRGGDTQISQFNLGMCLIDLADAEHDAQRSAPMRIEAAQWILSSANAGFPQAQAEAVKVYLDGTGVATDPVEAKKWELLYKRNVNRTLFGLPGLPDDLTQRLDVAMKGQNRAEARTRADNWTKTASSWDQ